MLNQPTIDKLCAMRMRGMAEALQQQMQEPDTPVPTAPECAVVRIWSEPNHGDTSEAGGGRI